MAWLGALIGSIVGAAVGLYGPVLLFMLLNIGTGSYEDVLFIWPVTIAAFPVAFGMITARLQMPRV